MTLVLLRLYCKYFNVLCFVSKSECKDKAGFRNTQIFFRNKFYEESYNDTQQAVEWMFKLTAKFYILTFVNTPVLFKKHMQLYTAGR